MLMAIYSSGGSRVYIPERKEGVYFVGFYQAIKEKILLRGYIGFFG